MLKLNYLAIIKVSGRDAVDFLNSQFTNDLDALAADCWQFNGYCNAKGRLIAIMRLFKTDDEVFLLLPDTLSGILIERLQKYVFRAKVAIEKIAEATCYYQNSADGSISGRAGALPNGQFKAENGDFYLNISSPDQQRFLFICLDGACNEMEALLTDQQKAWQHWRLDEINALIPTIHPETVEKFTPQHVNLDELGGVSFTKGCFPGQEVVARLHYLGKSKQSMRQLELSDVADDINPGGTITNPQTQKACRLVDVVKLNKHGYNCLVVGQFD